MPWVGVKKYVKINDIFKTFSVSPTSNGEGGVCRGGVCPMQGVCPGAPVWGPLSGGRHLSGGGVCPTFFIHIQLKSKPVLA